MPRPSWTSPGGSHPPIRAFALAAAARGEAMD